MYAIRSYYEPRPRTLRAKAVEAFRAMQLTLHVSKEEQLRLWLDRAPMGGNSYNFV